MNRCWIWLMSFLFCCCQLSCSQQKEVPLSIPEDKWIMILMDAHLLESAIQDANTRSRDTLKTTYYNQLYEIHGISEEEFLKNVTIMENQPKQLSRIYSRVMEEVSKLEAKEH